MKHFVETPSKIGPKAPFIATLSSASISYNQAAASRSELSEKSIMMNHQWILARTLSAEQPKLKGWWDAAAQRPSVTSHYQEDCEGDDGAGFCQTKDQADCAAREAQP